MITGKTVCTGVQRRIFWSFVFQSPLHCKVSSESAVALEMTFAGVYRINNRNILNQIVLKISTSLVSA